MHLNSDYVTYLKQSMSNATETQEKCRSYSEHIYSDFKPLQDPEDPDNSQ